MYKKGRKGSINMLVGMIQHHCLRPPYMSLKRIKCLRQFGFLRKTIPQRGAAIFETFLQKVRFRLKKWQICFFIPKIIGVLAYPSSAKRFF